MSIGYVDILDIIVLYIFSIFHKPFLVRQNGFGQSRWKGHPRVVARHHQYSRGFRTLRALLDILEKSFKYLASFFM